MIVTGPNMVRRGLMTPMLNRMEAEGVSYEIFDRLTADPTDKQVEEGVKLYIEKIGAELADTMAMCGVHDVKSITREMIY